MNTLKNILLASIFSVLAMFSTATAQNNPVDKQKLWHEFLTFKNQDLMANQIIINAITIYKPSPVRPRADELFKQLFFEGTEQTFEFSHVRFIAEFKSAEKTNYLVMLSPFTELPSGKPLQTLYFFDQNGKYNAQISLRTGWKMAIGGIEVIKNADFDFQTLKIITYRSEQNGDTSRITQYYAMLSDKLALVRLEAEKIDRPNKSNNEENLDNRNIYGCEYPSFGLPVVRKTAEEWKQALFSEKSVNILDALMWLSGRHYSVEELQYDQQITDTARKADPEFESNKSYAERCPNFINDAKVFAEMKADKEVQKRLLDLSRSEIIWIKEAAELALTPVEKNS